MANRRGVRLAPGLGLGFIAVALSACMTVTSDLSGKPEEVTGPFPHDYERVVRDWIETDFLDITSVRGISISTPVSGHAQRWRVSERKHGWYSRVTFKARDTVGASKGKLAYAVLIREGAVIASQKLLY